MLLTKVPIKLKYRRLCYCGLIVLEWTQVCDNSAILPKKDMMELHRGSNAELHGKTQKYAW